MRTAIRKAGVACSALLASTALAVTTATGAWGSSSALVVGGLETPSMHDLVMAQLLGGSLKNQDRVSVHWPAQAGPYTGSNDLSLGDSIAVGITNLNAEIEAALGRLAAPNEKVTVIGLSAGSLVVTEVLRQLVEDGNAPSPDQITFVAVADSSRQKVIDKARYNNAYEYTYQPAPESQYDVVVVTGEFDGASDFPDRWWNFVALLNAMAGAIYVHIPVMFADLSTVPDSHITVDVNKNGGTTTHYLVPTEKLPLVQMFPFLKSQEASLRAQVEKGYARYDNKATAQQARATAAPAALEEVDDTAPPAAEKKAEAAVTEPAADEAVKDDDAAAESEAEAGEAVEAEAEAEAVEAEAAEAEAAEAEAAEAEAEAVEADAGETEAADTDQDSDAADSAPSADSGTDSGASESGASESE